MSSASTPQGPRPGQPPLDFGRQPPVRVVLEQGGFMRPWLNRLLWIGLVIAILVAVSFNSMYHNYFQTDPQINEKYFSLSPTGAEKIAIIDVEGTIMHTDGFVKWQIDRVLNDDSVKAVVLRVDSPGGTVTGSDYILHHLNELTKKKKIPLVVSMGGIAASGGYYVSMSVGDTPDSIFAEPATWTGSIGVIIPHYDLSGLLEKWNVDDDSIASNPLKQMGSPTKHQPPEIREKERAILQTLVNDSFQDFKDVVKSGRPNFRTADGSKQLDDAATGQIYTAKQALKLGLVDKLGYIEDAVDRALELAKLDKNTTRVVKYTRPKGLLDDVLSGAQGHSQQLDLSALLDLTAPRAYYLSSWLPTLASSHAQ